MHAAMNLRWSKLGISFLLLIIATVDAFCPPGCTCSNETRNVICDNVKVDSIPIFLNPALTRLSLRNSQVRLDKDSIRLYKDLEYLDLSHNQIEEFPEEFFDQLTNLKDLRLTGNRIAKLDTNLFANTERLENLDLSANKIDQIEANAFDVLTSLVSLNLSSNKLVFIELNFNTLSHLKELDISRNDIRTIASGSFNELVALEHLDLSDNSIGHLHPQIFAHQSQLLRLNLQGNRLQEIQRNVFDGLFILNSLNLSRNMLKTIDVSNWLKLEKLDILDLSRNPLFSLDASPFKGLIALRVLDLNSIDYLTEIKNNSFDGLYQLQELSLSGCPQLSRIHSATFVDNLALKRVDLSSNALETLSPETLRWEMLEFLNLAGNPWNCNCALLSFMPSVLRRIKRSGNRAVCVQPEQMSNVELANAKSPLCSSTANSTLILLGAAVFLTLLIIIVLFAFCVRSALCWRQKRKLSNNKNARLPLYAPSSFSDSLIYDKQHDPSTTMVVTCEPSGRSITSSNSLNYPYPHFRPPFCYQQNEPTDYYSSIPLPPPAQIEPCNHCSSGYGYATCSLSMLNGMPMDGRHYSSHYTVEASPYAIGQNMRPPNFTAPPPPPSVPPPKLAYRHLDT